MSVSNTTTSTSVLLAGATGLVGGECLRLLLADPTFSRVVALTRRPLALAAAPHKLQARVVDFDRLAEHASLFRVDQIICALGTTIKQAGSRERFRQVDLVYPLEIARLGLEHGARHVLLVSSLGANARSRVFYNRVKGELENALRALPYRAITIVRPSLLLGERRQVRLGEAIGARLGFLAPGRYRPVRASAVAMVLVDAARQDLPGLHLIESGEIRRRTADRP